MMAKNNGGKKKVAADNGDGNKLTGDKRGKSTGKSEMGSVEVEDSSDSEDISNTDVSSEEEEVVGAVGVWSSSTKKGRKGKKSFIYVMEAERNVARLFNRKKSAFCVNLVANGSISFVRSSVWKQWMHW